MDLPYKVYFIEKDFPPVLLASFLTFDDAVNWQKEQNNLSSSEDRVYYLEHIGGIFSVEDFAKDFTK